MAVGVMSSIVYPYKRDHTIDAADTVKNGEAVFTHGSPHSSVPGTDRGTPAAIGSTGPAVPVMELRTGSRARRRCAPAAHGWALAQDVPAAMPFCRRKCAGGGP